MVTAMLPFPTSSVGSLLPATTRLTRGFSLLLLAAALVATGCAQLVEPGTNSGPPYERVSLDIVPLPASIQATDGRSAYLGKETAIHWEAGLAEAEASKLEAYLEAGTGWDLRMSQGAAADGAIALALRPELEAELGPDSYRLVVRGAQITIHGATPAGLSYGVQTLKQMLPAQFASPLHSEHFPGAYFPYEELTIEDAPRFSWRGMMLDTGRYLYSVDDIKSFLDTMAFYKFNVLHLHLTEDQGWRMEIKAFPKLTEVGSMRASTPVVGDRRTLDGKPYGGFYTQDDLREIVAYAADLHIDVMPEIELPGHSSAAIASYPELGNPEFRDDVEVGTYWGVHKNTLSPSQYTLDFYEQVFDEVMEIFPFGFIHIGADEAPKFQWENSAFAQERIKELGLKDEHELQAWFVAHFERYFSERGRRLVGWDEIQEGGLPSGATMMVWRGWHFGVEAARAGHDIIMAPTSHTYFDYYQAGPGGEPEAIGGMLPLEKVYSFEPLPPELTAEEAKHVLGAQAQLWSEYLPNWKQVEYMAFPRMLALAEVVWSPKDQRDFSSFQSRAFRQFDLLDALGVNYRIPAPALDSGAVFFTDAVEVPVPQQFEGGLTAPDVHAVWLVYTTDGSEPTVDSPRFHSAQTFHETTTLRMSLLRNRERVGLSSTVQLTKVAPGEHSELGLDGLKPGLERVYFYGGKFSGPLLGLAHFQGVFANENPGGWKQGATSAIADKELEGLEQYQRLACFFTGAIQIKEPGRYTFRLASDDGSRLSIGGFEVIENDGEHGVIERSASVVLTPGIYPVDLQYFNAGGAGSLEFAIEGPGDVQLLHLPND
jgi:hexosaminidase